MANKLPDNIVNSLKEPIPDFLYKVREIKKQDVKYITGNTIINKLNDVFGYSWSFEIVHKEVIQSLPHVIEYKDGTSKEYPQKPYVEVLGRLTIPEYGITKEQYGTKQLLGTASDQEGATKAAATDALKKCASMFGIGIEADDFDDNNEPGYKSEQPKYEEITQTHTRTASPESLKTEQPASHQETSIQIDWNPNEINRLKEYKALLGITENSQMGPYIREFFDNPNATLNDITPDNISKFNQYMRKKVEEI